MLLIKFLQIKHEAKKQNTNKKNGKKMRKKNKVKAKKCPRNLSK